MWQLKSYQVTVLTLTQLFHGLRKRANCEETMLTTCGGAEATKTRNPEVGIF